MPYPLHPTDPTDPNYDAKLDPGNPKYDANDPRLVFADPTGRGDPTLGAKPKKPNPKDYSDLFGDDNVKTTKTAGPAVADDRPKAENYADLFEDTGTEKPPTVAQSTQSSNQSGIFSGVPGFIREHPYASGALAAVLAAPVLGLAPEIGIPVAGALMGLLRNRAIQTGTGIALGQQLGPRASEGLHYLLRLSGIEGEQAP